ncbi:MAG: hypothetical protein FWG03_01800 [Clostridiales bacterium]|nr:hypothetical protein [Clostridiales bacterium]
MEYKKNHKQVTERLGALYTGGAKDRIFAKMMVVSPTLKEYRHFYPEGEIPYPDLKDRVEFWDRLLSEQTWLEDDSIPGAYMSEFDGGLYGGLLGSEVRFLYYPERGWVTSMTVPALDDFLDWRKLKLDENGYWAEKFRGQLECFKQASRGKFRVAHFILIDALNLSIELRGGTNMMLDLLDYPDEMPDYFEFGRELNFWIWDHYFKTIGLFEGGTVSNYGQWMPGRIVSESLDPFHMMSLDYFEEWGRENAEKVFAHYDGGCIHIHQGNGKHLIQPTSTIKGIKLIALIDEIWNDDKAYLHMAEYDRLRGGVPLLFTIPYAVFDKMLHNNELAANCLYNVAEVPDTDTANRLMEKVRDYRK